MEREERTAQVLRDHCFCTQREMIQCHRGGLGGHGGSFAGFMGFNFLVFFFGRATFPGSGVGAAPSFTFFFFSSS